MTNIMDNSPNNAWKNQSSAKTIDIKSKNISTYSLREIRRNIFKENDQDVDMKESTSADNVSSFNRKLCADDSNDGYKENSTCRKMNKYLTTLTHIGMEKVINRNNWSEDDQNTLELEDILLLDESTWIQQQISDAIKEARNEIEEIPENSENDTGFGRTPESQCSPYTRSQRSMI